MLWSTTRHVRWLPLSLILLFSFETRHKAVVVVVVVDAAAAAAAAAPFGSSRRCQRHLLTAAFTSTTLNRQRLFRYSHEPPCERERISSVKFTIPKRRSLQFRIPQGALSSLWPGAEVTDVATATAATTSCMSSSVYSAAAISFDSANDTIMSSTSTGIPWIGALRVASLVIGYIAAVAWVDRPRGQLYVKVVAQVDNSSGVAVAVAVASIDSPTTDMDTFDTGTVASVQVRPSTVPGAGLGVFATTSLPKGTILGTYPGVVLPLARNVPKLQQYPCCEGYIWRFSDNAFVIDPTNAVGVLDDTCRGGSRFSYPLSEWLFQSTVLSTVAVAKATTLCRINEPPRGKDVNVVTSEDCSQRTVTFALERDVEKEEELYIDYGLYFDRSNYGGKG